MNDKTLAGFSKELDYPRPWRLWKAGERSEIPHIADANGIVIARAEGNIWTWQDFVAPVILAAVNDHERLQLVFEEACNEVKMSHGKPCFCKYCWEPSEATPGGGSAKNQPVARGIATGPAPETLPIDPNSKEALSLDLEKVQTELDVMTRSRDGLRAELRAARLEIVRVSAEGLRTIGVALQEPRAETGACAVVMAAEALLEVLPVPNDYYGDEAQALREALDNAPAETGVSADSRDAARWRAFVRSTGHEVDMSTGPGKNKDLHIRINCTGCERYFESGAPDYEGTLNATMDDEINLQANELKAEVQHEP